ncbi:MAG: HIT domain-containing protein, partial [Dehalococcoidia bacterium]
MEYIWAPWRIEYILGEKEKDCIFCHKPKQDKDKENLLLYRGKRNLVMMNLYPYNPGHLMVAPYRHTNILEALDDEEMLEHLQLVTRCVAVLKEAMKPNGFNIGINLGRVAGAGIEDHIHTHIVPRWNGDT